MYPEISEIEAVKTLRKSFGYQNLRRTRSTAIIHSGGRQTILNCLCGARHTCATNYRNAKHVSNFIKEHSGCAQSLLESLQK